MAGQVQVLARDWSACSSVGQESSHGYGQKGDTRLILEPTRHCIFLALPNCKVRKRKLESQ